jgi:predicted transcriptional regulator
MKQTLTAKEEMLMNIFWAHEPLFIRDLISYIPEPKPHYNTVATLVKFLEEKGFVEREPMANSFRYKVKISERQYRGSTVSDVVAQYYNNSYASLVSQFVEEDKIDIDELKALIATIESKKK